MPRVRMLRARVETADLRKVQVPEKVAKPVYSSPEFRAWREMVVDRAGRQCEAVDEQGRRCPRAEPYARMFADHIIEIEDGGALYDLANGQCLCGSHHTLKTNAVRAARTAS